MQCTSCGCEWDSDEGFYHTADGQAIQPCKVCRCDSRSIYYIQNAEIERTARVKRYYRDVEASRSYERRRKREYRARLAQQMSVV